ncbi:MAG: ABC transporter substrate-binding protein [Bacteroidetes bacterium]|nr:ABC transporter substrate-binding protein [Bacteroidota bacterium]
MKRATPNPTMLARMFLVAALCSVASLLLVSCGGDDEAAALKPAKGGRFYGGTFRMNEVQEIRTLDPARLNDAPSHHVVHQIGELLFDFDSTLKLVPELAESCDISADGLTYTYHLRKGVLFQDSPCFPNGQGREMKASDVKYCFDRMLDSREGGLGSSYFGDKVVGAQAYFDATGSNGAKPIPPEGVSGFKAVDDYTFSITLKSPFGAFKNYVALGMCYIYPKEAVQHFGKDFYRNLVGTGPFILTRFQKDQGITLKRNPKYWGKDEFGNQLPYLDAITWNFIKDERQQITEFTSGHLDEAYRIPTEFFRNVIDENGKVTPAYAQYHIFTVPALSTQFYGMLVTSDLFKDRRVRQAFNYAIDREKIIKYVLQGQAAGPAVHGLVPPSMPGYDVASIKGYSYDPAKAQALMAEAGYPGGKGFPPVTIQLNSGGGRNLLVAQAIQSMLTSELGVKVDVKILEWPQHQELLENGKAPLYRLGWIADYPDPENFLNLFYGKTIPPTGPSQINSMRYANPEFDALFEKALATTNDSIRYRLYRDAEQIAVNDAPMMFIYNDMDYRLVQPYVKGYGGGNAMDRRDLREVWFDYGNK